MQSVHARCHLDDQTDAVLERRSFEIEMEGWHEKRVMPNMGEAEHGEGWQ